MIRFRHISGLLVFVLFVGCLSSASGGELGKDGRGVTEDLSRKDKDKSAQRFKYKYKVRRGDNLTKIASRYGVSIKEIRRWNSSRIGKHDRLKVGSELRIYSALPIRVKREAWYVVKKGDSLKKIAAETGVSVDHLATINSIRKGRIKPGQKLLYLLEGPEEDSESIGKASGGRLERGEKMPPGPGYDSHRPNSYGTNETITHLIECIGEYRKQYPTGPEIIVGNLSSSRGGHLDPHRSHQSGRDVDLGYIHKKKFQPVTSMIPTDGKNLDAEKTWFFMKCFLDTDDVSVMYVDRKIQEALVKYLKGKKVKRSYLAKIFQYPLGSKESVVKDYKGHHHHIHLRFKCPKGDDRCVE